MELCLDLDGMIIYLQIIDYHAHTQGNFISDNWCNCKLRILSDSWLDYNRQGELLLSHEVDELREEFHNLLNGNLHSIKEIGFTEPDFEFTLFPVEDMRENPAVLYCTPGCEFTDISVDWKIHFWNGGLTANYLSLTLNRKNLILFTDYLSAVTKSK